MEIRTWGPGIEDSNEGFGREDIEQADDESTEKELAAVVRWVSDVWTLFLDAENEYRHAVTELKSATRAWIFSARHFGTDLGEQSVSFFQALIHLGGACALDVGVSAEALIRAFLLFYLFE